MKKNLYEIYKGNKRNTGSAIQIGNCSKGLTIQVAKQDQALQTGFHLFAWKDYSQSATLKIEELTLLLSKFKSLKEKNYEELRDLKTIFAHERSTSPKTLVFEFEELPIHSKNVILKLKILSNDEKNVEFIFNKDEYEAFFLIIEDKIRGVLGTNLTESTLVNKSMRNDPNGIEGCRTIKSIYLPNLCIGETIVGIKNTKLKIIDKYFDATEAKPVYFVTEIN
ncbi:MAG: hypothetical protein ACRCW9_09870 [Cetobacterium sp.]